MDAALLAEVDGTLGQVCGQATRAVMRREFELFGDARCAPLVHRFASAVLSPHLNFHRPCLFATPVADENGKVRKAYRDDDVATPYERLKSIKGAERFLKPGLSFAALDAEANALSDLESARLVNRERDKLFHAVGAAWPSAA